MKEKLHPAGAVLMALLVLFSTLSFSMDMHFCGGRLVDFSLFEKAESCGMMPEAADVPGDCLVGKAGMDCCSDVRILVEGQEDFKVSFDQLTVDQQFFITSFVYAYYSLFEATENSPRKDWGYAPPPLIQDVQVLYQTFLI